MRSTTTSTANNSETTLAAIIAASSATAGWPTNSSEVPAPASAPTNIKPSAVRLSTPERSATIRPSAASA